MSYHLYRPRRTRIPRRSPAPVPYYPLPAYPLVPLSAAPPSNHRIRNNIIGIVVVLVLVAFLYWLNQQGQRPVRRNSRPSKQSTSVMARNLYKRLQMRGGVNDTTMHSLRQLSRGA